MSRYIDVDKVIDKMNEVLINEKHKGNEDTVAYFAFTRIIQALQQEPTADVEEVRHGEYINDQDTPISLYIAECSCCNVKTAMGLYCMWCGAKLDKEKEE